MKKMLAWAMLVGSTIGFVLSLPFVRVIGASEPPLVLGLSWFALIFASLDAILIESKD